MPANTSISVSRQCALTLHDDDAITAFSAVAPSFASLRLYFDAMNELQPVNIDPSSAFLSPPSLPFSSINAKSRLLRDEYAKTRLRKIPKAFFLKSMFSSPAGGAGAGPAASLASSASSFANVVDDENEDLTIHVQFESNGYFLHAFHWIFDRRFMAADNIIAMTIIPPLTTENDNENQNTNTLINNHNQTLIQYLAQENQRRNTFQRVSTLINPALSQTPTSASATTQSASVLSAVSAAASFGVFDDFFTFSIFQ